MGKSMMDWYIRVSATRSFCFEGRLSAHTHTPTFCLCLCLCLCLLLACHGQERVFARTSGDLWRGWRLFSVRASMTDFSSFSKTVRRSPHPAGLLNPRPPFLGLPAPGAAPDAAGDKEEEEEGRTGCDWTLNGAPPSAEMICDPCVASSFLLRFSCSCFFFCLPLNGFFLDDMLLSSCVVSCVLSCCCVL